ncbi:hypothetical protein PABG_04163 [Paracoccidioides brasiliensis Pb03]|uniref:Uncharacterized protein n=1 Tax=Paracoccidioides brasiliensis (strain Pb18) TaxID=502780 RepID=C1GC03_PARBD|nr:uncharacterized protein PADG_04525 [Paracoccidioides brasiliensis Pb18]EEH21952.2 hypothetical protein PABG_04163 [Paracoccidioides brasiliensis Pb03]EEH48446.1 hypothetical protein PADG_04525 [Paracoccidioides brasiliensis Pb18]
MSSNHILQIYNKTSELLYQLQSLETELLASLPTLGEDPMIITPARRKLKHSYFIWQDYNYPASGK